MGGGAKRTDVNSFTNVGRESRGLFSISIELASFPRSAGVWGHVGWAGEACHNRLDQHKAFGKLARRIRERVKPISQSKLNTQRNEPADVISSYPFRPKGISPSSGSVFRKLPRPTIVPSRLSVHSARPGTNQPPPRLAICPPLQRGAKIC